MSIATINKLLRVRNWINRALWPLTWTVNAVHEAAHLLALLSVRPDADYRIGIGCRADSRNPRRVQLGFGLTGSLWVRGFADLPDDAKRRVLISGPLATFLGSAMAMIVAPVAWKLLTLPGLAVVAATCLAWGILAYIDTHVNMMAVQWEDGYASDGWQLAEIRERRGQAQAQAQAQVAA